MKLVITEKPSVARILSVVLKSNERKDGFFIGNDYIISWCIGHLVNFAKAENYNENYAKWRYSDLPIIPKDWKYIVSSDKAKQMNLLSELMNRKDINVIINACDAGREGELIFRLVYEYCKCKKTIKRLWISSMEESSIINGFNNLHSGDNYNKLYESALCRTKADWIVGINATRLFSILYGETLNIGRVQSPTLALIVKREQEIVKFIKEPFYIPEIDLKDFKAVGERLKDKSLAEDVILSCNGKSAFVKSISKQKKSISCPKLFDLTTLQREANQIFGYTAQQTIDYAQSLYEKKVITYPRTDSRYLTHDMENNLKSLIKSVSLVIPFLNSMKLSKNINQVIDSSKVTDHHAIIPTNYITTMDISSLPTGERNILYMINNRLICAVGDKSEYNETIITIECNGYIFMSKCKNIINQGFQLIDKIFKSYCKVQSDVDNIFEPLELPETINGKIFNNVVVNLKEGYTFPPKLYTEDTLLKAMETAGTQELIPDVERKGLGTSATRAGIIEKLIKSEFIERKGKNLLSTTKGKNLIAVLPDILISPSLTVEWENKLKYIEQGNLTQKEFMEDIYNFIIKIVDENTIPNNKYKLLFTSNQNNNIKHIGICPCCKNQILENNKGFFCENKACKFAVWKNNIFFKSKKIELTKDIINTLLKEGRIFMPKLYSEKTGKDYSATIILEDSSKYVNFKIEFNSNKN